MINKEIIKELIHHKKYILFSFEELIHDVNKNIVIKEMIKCIKLYDNEGIEQSVKYINTNNDIDTSQNVQIHLYDVHICNIKIYYTHIDDKISSILSSYIINLYEKIIILNLTNSIIIGTPNKFEGTENIKKVVNKIIKSSAKFKFDDIIGNNKKFLECIKMAKIASKSSSNVLIYGESGTGKELCAHAIHNESARSKYPFISINCAAIPKDLLESELFGYEEGSFTGALKKGKAGKFEMAHMGSIFLDEIGDMPLDMQSKLLRVLQDKKLNRIGSNNSLDIDVRIICATNKNLFKLCEEGFFRNDLYYRLNVLNIVLTPLRERLDDVKKLSYFFLNKFNNKLEKNITMIDDEVFKLFYENNWAGNVRELENIIERAVNLCEGDEINISHINLDVYKNNTINNNQFTDLRGYIAIDKITNSKENLKTIADLEQDAIKHALIIYNGNISEAARALGITRNTIYNKMKKFYND